MLSQSSVVLLVVASIATLGVSQQLPTLEAALASSGASRFASLIQSDTNLLALYHSGEIKTVFAPADSVSPPAAMKARQDTGVDTQQLLYQGCRSQTSLVQASQSLPGTPLAMALPAPGLNTRPQENNPQVVTTDTRPANVTNLSRRWDLHSIVRRQSNQTSQSLLKISSGLGNIANVIKGDIPFDGGLIQITDR